MEHETLTGVHALYVFEGKMNRAARRDSVRLHGGSSSSLPVIKENEPWEANESKMFEQDTWTLKAGLGASQAVSVLLSFVNLFGLIGNNSCDAQINTEQLNGVRAAHCSVTPCECFF